MWAVGLKAGIQDLSWDGWTRMNLWHQRASSTLKTPSVFCQSTAGCSCLLPLRSSAQLVCRAKKKRRQDFAWVLAMNSLKLVKETLTVYLCALFIPSDLSKCSSLESTSLSAGMVAVAVLLTIMTIITIIFGIAFYKSRGKDTTLLFIPPTFLTASVAKWLFLCFREENQITKEDQKHRGR